MDWSPPRKPAPRPAGFIEPCIPTLAEKPPAGPAWIHEIKHDGFRLLVWRDGERVRLFTRRGFDWTDRYPHALSGLGATLLPMPAEPRPRCRCVEEEHRGRWQPIRQRRSVACPLVLLAASSARILCLGLSPAFPRRQAGGLTCPGGMGAGASLSQPRNLSEKLSAQSWAR